MSKNIQHAATTKYVIKAKFEVEGVVEKPDVIGALFGQTEGLFGPDLDLRELQKTGRIGRIEIDIQSKKDKTNGRIKIPSSLDKASTAIIAAAIESVDRIGPCTAKVNLEAVEDVREEKRKLILTKAKNILRNWILEVTPSSEEVVKEVSDSVKPPQIIQVGSESLPAGPDVPGGGSIIIVEGRADVLNLLKCGIRNAVGLDGTKIPETIIKISRNKEITAFLDGDRGGDLILKELLQVADIDYISRAPPGKEVEELTPKEVMRSLREKIPVKEAKLETHRPRIQLPPPIIDAAKGLVGTLEAKFFDKEGKELQTLPVGELAEKIKVVEKSEVLLFDGVITQRLLDLAEEKKVSIIIGDRLSEIAKLPTSLKVLTISEVLKQ